MRKNIVYSLVLVFVLIGVFGLAFRAQQAEASGTIYIKADGSVGGTTYIVSDDNVTYTFTADITDTIVVQRSNIIIDGKGHTLQGLGGEGFYLAVINNVTIRNTNIKGFGVGIQIIFGSYHNTISGNNITTNGIIGIQVGLWDMDDSSNNNIISGNNITANDYYGIYVGPSTSHNTISGNNIMEPREGLDPIPYGIFLEENSGNNIISGNNIVGLCLKGICGEGSSYNTISGNNITNNVSDPSHYDPYNSLDGIHLVSSSYNTISLNNITANHFGIWIPLGSHYNTISGNKITDNSYGILFNGYYISGGPSNNNIIFGNNITANYWNGIYLDESSNNTISGNNIRGSCSGIELVTVSNNSIVGNNITNNWMYGISLGGSNNVFYHNNFVDNTQQVSQSGYNSWDNDIEGNYWSDYTGVDSNHDGIGDSALGADHYPLMGPFHSFNTTLGKYVNVISNSTIESFQHFESNSTIIIHVSNMTANQTHGFCRISIPYQVMSEPFNVTIDGVNPTYWNYTLYDNGTHRWIYFEYEHTTREIVIIPEFPYFLILPLFMIVTLMAVIVYRRQLKKGNIVHQE
ncbi:MAG: right-handed parallel beta-helix repeat-containing protein [Candidatus Bathyarchaeota archaeon]|nr:right-handed parallel beta-helix repeat-containing protein [Candidatus Bathyarchaeota archaeon]MDH5787714.1 right-handed parallel beta-helix repeat-containing protein [Candidatus Bathyarchaeota archaeon]